MVKAGLCWPFAAAAVSQFGCGGGSSSAPPPPPGDGYPGTDDQLLEEIEKAGFLFFWEQADPTTGQIKDRAFAAGGNDNRPVSSIASTGLGLAGRCIGDLRGDPTHSGVARPVRATLSLLAKTLQPLGNNRCLYLYVYLSTRGP